MRRSGFSLLELVIATAIMAALVTSVTVLMRSGQAVWDEHDSDVAKLESAHATVRHLVRHLRQSVAVSSITAANQTAGSISVVSSSGATNTWTRTGNSVYFGSPTANQLLAEGLTGLQFTGYRADGTTVSATPAEIRSVECVATVQLNRNTSPTRIIRCRAWLRAW